MDFDQLQFWQAVYIAAIRSGANVVEAKLAADLAAKHYAEVEKQEE